MADTEITEATDEPTGTQDAGTGAESDPGSDQGEAALSEAAPASAPSAPTVPAGGPGGGTGGAATVSAGDDIDVDAEYSLIEQVTAKLEAGDISPDEANRQTAKHLRNLAKAAKAAAEPAKKLQQTLNEQENARTYWQQWGKGKDVAQVSYGKTVAASSAQKLYAEAVAETEAHPRYQRPEYQNNENRLRAVVYEKWVDKLEAESKKPRAAAQTTGRTTSARVSGSGGPGAASTASTVRKSARERMDAGEYNIADDAKRLGMM